MGHLIDKLKNLRQVENPEHLPSWTYSIANFGIIIFIILLCPCFKVSHFLTASCLSHSVVFVGL
jgi:hypothetical protein